MKRRDLLKGAAASIAVGSKPPFVPITPSSVKSKGFRSLGASTAESCGSGSDAMTRFLSCLGPDEWGQPANTTASPVFFANDTRAADYLNYPISGLTGSQVAKDNAGTTGPDTVWTAWNGACHDTIANRALIGPSGGHLGYCGNEVYAFDFSTLAVYRVSTPDDYPTSGFGGCSVSTPGSNIFPNGDPLALHTYSGLVFMRGKGVDGSLWAGGNAEGTSGNNFPIWLDLSKCVPYRSLPVLGIGWSHGHTGWNPTTPAVQVYDPATNRIYCENLQIGGGPPNLQYYDFASNTISTAGLTGNNLRGLPNYSSGTLRDGHRELWTVGAADLGYLAMQVSLIDGTARGFYPSFGAVGYPGICYVPPIDKMLVYIGGNALYMINCADRTTASYMTTGSVPASLPTNGCHTRLFCDTIHHCFILWYDGNSDIYVLKTSLF